MEIAEGRAGEEDETEIMEGEEEEEDEMEITGGGEGDEPASEASISERALPFGDLPVISTPLPSELGSGERSCLGKNRKLDLSIDNRFFFDALMAFVSG